MRILQVVHGFSSELSGGTEVYTYNLCQELAKKHSVYVFHRVNNLKMHEYAFVQNRQNSIDAFGINNNMRLYDSFEATYKNDAIAEKFGVFLDKIKPDIVHIQSLLYLGAKLVEEAKKRSIPIVFTLHDYWLICPQGQFLKNNQVICNSIDYKECAKCTAYQLGIKRNIANIYYFTRRFLPKNIANFIKGLFLTYCRICNSNNAAVFNHIKRRAEYLKEICNKVDLFLAPSMFLIRRFHNFDIPVNKITFLPYGFDLNKSLNAFKSSSSKIRFAFIGNLIPAKGVHVLIKAFNRIRSDKAELKIYGPDVSYKGLLFNYSKRIRKLVKNSNIRLMGSFDNKDIAKIFSGIDALVVPSLWYENSPLIIQEAFATKTPVIASNIGGIPELITNGVNGILFHPNDINDLYGKIRQFIENPNLIKSIMQNILPPKSIEKNTRELEAIYESLVIRCQNILV